MCRPRLVLRIVVACGLLRTGVTLICSFLPSDAAPWTCFSGMGTSFESQTPPLCLQPTQPALPRFTLRLLPLWTVNSPGDPPSSALSTSILPPFYLLTTSFLPPFFSTPSAGVQAYAIGSRVLAVQFHPEVDEAYLDTWCEELGPAVHGEIMDGARATHCLDNSAFVVATGRLLRGFIERC